jgi:hypothetical protein
MFKGFILGALATLVLAALCAYVVVQSGIIPAGADSEPLPVESYGYPSPWQIALGKSLHRQQRSRFLWQPQGITPLAPQ